jgi:hypothetical protein
MTPLTFKYVLFIGEEGRDPSSFFFLVKFEGALRD